MKPAGGSASDASTSASDDDSEGEDGGGFAGPGAGRGMGSKVKAAALELLEGARDSCVLPFSSGGGWPLPPAGRWRHRAGWLDSLLHVSRAPAGSPPPTACCAPCHPATHAGKGEGEAPAKGLFALPFMKRALERRKAEAQAAAQEALAELEGGGGGGGGAAAPPSATPGGAAGRLAFTGSGVDQRAQWERVARLEAAAADDSDLASDEVGAGSELAGLKLAGSRAGWLG